MIVISEDELRLDETVLKYATSEEMAALDEMARNIARRMREDEGRCD